MRLLGKYFWSVLGGLVPIYGMATEPYLLPAYTVSATRMDTPGLEVPFSVSRVDLGEMQSTSMQLSLEESLKGVPGVFVLNPYNFAQDSRIAIRGFGARANFGIRGIRLLVDGIPATTPDGQGSVDGIDLGSAGSMQVIRGPAAALYGAASGGVILIETETGPEIPFVETRWTTGHDGLRQGQLKAGGQQGRIHYLIHATKLDYEGYRKNNQTENERIQGKFVYKVSETSNVTALVNVIDYPLQNDPGGLTLAELRMDPRQARDRNLQFESGESVQQEQFGLVYKTRINEFHALELKSYFIHRDFANKLPFMEGGQVSFERDFFGGGALYRFDGELWKLAVGIDLDLQEDFRKNLDNLDGDPGPSRLNQKERIQSAGMFVSSTYDVSERLTLSAALRHDYVDFEVADRLFEDGDDSGRRKFKQTSPMLGITWKAIPGIAVFANAATAFETPTTTELANPQGGGFNPDLTSQTATNLEAGIKGSSMVGDRWMRFEFAVFKIAIEDALVPFELNTQPGRDFYRNAGKSRRKGVEGVLQWELSPDLMAIFSYTWSDFDYQDFQSSDGNFSGNVLPGIPEHFGNIQLTYRKDPGLFFQWNTRYTGNFYADDANERSIEAYSVTDLRFGWERSLGEWTLEPFLGLNNIFNQNYSANIRINAFGGRYYEPAPKRNAYGGIRVRYQFQ